MFVADKRESLRRHVDHRVLGWADTQAYQDGIRRLWYVGNSCQTGRETSQAPFREPSAVALDGAGNLWVADTGINGYAFSGRRLDSPAPAGISFSGRRILTTSDATAPAVQ